MTISSTNTKNSYSGDGSTVAFSYTFKILDDDDITVILRTNATGAETVQTKTTHYSVSGVGNAGGGTITFVSAPATTVTVVLLRNVPLTQTTDYTPNDPFPAVTHEDALDKLTLMAQDTQEEVDRSIKLSRTNTMTSTEFTVGATDRANKVFAFDSSGELAVTQEIGTFQGNWAASTAYAERDLVKDTSTNNIFIVNSAHTSSGSQPLTTNANASKYDLIVDAASATTSATNAATSATAASNSATAAANSASAAATSESNAAGSEAGVAADAAAAAASAASASTSATNASTSETNASNSASAASTSATNAATSATSASNSASAAGTSESNAATSATNASNSASAAATSASNASTSESNASTSETNAATSASSAASDASAAATSAAAAAASFDAFDDIYLGAKASAPTVDNDGDALTVGDQYFNTTSNELFIWNGSAFQAASPNVIGDTTPQLGGDLDTNGNDINFGDNDKAIFGAGSDLQIYHDGTGNNSYILDAGAGDLYIAGENNVRITSNTGLEAMATLTANGAVTLFHDNAAKLATASNGVNVTGSVTISAGSIFAPDDSAFYFGDQSVYITGSGSDERLQFITNSSERMRITGGGSVGIGLTTPRQLLHVNQTTASSDSIIRITNSNTPSTGGHKVEFADGTGTTEGSTVFRYGFIAGERSSGANDGHLIFGTKPDSSTSPTERVRIDSSGRVGIGTSSPEGLIGLPATASNTPKFRLQSASTNTDFAISSYADANGTYVSLGANHYLNSSGNDAVFETTDRSAYVLLDARNNGMVAFGTNSSGVATERMRIDSSGNVGINTTGPTEDLHIKGKDGAHADVIIQAYVGYNSGLNFNDNAGMAGRIVYNHSNNFMEFDTNGSEAMRIASSGNVGIGTTTLTDKLNVEGDIRINNAVESPNNLNLEAENGSMRFYTGSGSPSERLRIDSSGNLLVGKTSESDFSLSAVSVSPGTSAANIKSSRSSGGTDPHVYFYNSNGLVGSITTGGSATAYNTSSDHRLKENAVDMTGAIDRVKALAPKRFNFIADADTTVDGFLAHEAQAVVPEAVTGTHNEVDNDGDAVMQGIDQSKLVPLLTGALQEAIAKIETLEARITALEGA